MKHYSQILVDNYGSQWVGAGKYEHMVRRKFDTTTYLTSVNLVELHYNTLVRPTINNIALGDKPDNSPYWTARKIKHVIDLITGHHKLNHDEIADVEWDGNIFNNTDILKLLGINENELGYVLYRLGLDPDFTVTDYDENGGPEYWMPRTKSVMDIIMHYRKAKTMHGKRQRMINRLQ